MDLITRQQYRHFELTTEWRAARGGKSGPLSCHRSAAARVAAWSAMQLLDNAHHPDGQTPETAARALYGLIAPRRTVLQPLGSFTTARVVVRASRGTVAQWGAGRGVCPQAWRRGGSQQVSGAAWLWPGGPRSHGAPASRCPGVVPSPLSASSPGSADGRSAGPGAGVGAGTASARTSHAPGRRRDQRGRDENGAPWVGPPSGRPRCPASSCSMPRCTPPSASRRPFSPPWSTRAGCPPRSWDSCWRILAIRLLTAPLAGRLGDFIQGLRLVLVVCLVLAAGVTLGYLPAQGFWPFLALSLGHAAALAPVTILADASALGAAVPPPSSGRRGFSTAGYVGRARRPSLLAPCWRDRR